MITSATSLLQSANHGIVSVLAPVFRDSMLRDSMHRPREGPCKTLSRQAQKKEGGWMDSESGGYIVYLSRDGTKERYSNKKVIAKRKCGGGGGACLRQYRRRHSSRQPQYRALLSPATHTSYLPKQQWYTMRCSSRLSCVCVSLSACLSRRLSVSLSLELSNA